MVMLRACCDVIQNGLNLTLATTAPPPPFYMIKIEHL